MNGNTSVSLSANHAIFQSNTVSLTQVAFAHPVLSILKIVSPKQLSLARCYQSNTFSLTRVIAFATHPVLSVEYCLGHSGSLRSPSVTILRSVGRRSFYKLAQPSQEVYVLWAPLPAGPMSARDSTFPAPDLRYISVRSQYRKISALRPYIMPG